MGAHEQVPGPHERAVWVDAPPLARAPGPVGPVRTTIPPPGVLDDDVDLPVPEAFVPIRYPLAPVTFSTAPPRIQPLRWDQPRARRLRGSQVTFGILGRLVVTGLVVLFVLWMLNAGPFAFFLVPGVPGLVWLLADNWRKAPERRGPAPTVPVGGPRAAVRDPFAPLPADADFDPHVRPPDATRS